jgi:hypothetical protein
VAVFGDATSVLRAPDASGGAEFLELITLDAEGAVVDRGPRLNRVPVTGPHAMVRLGEELVVAWLGLPPSGDSEGQNRYSRVTIARVAP